MQNFDLNYDIYNNYNIWQHSESMIDLQKYSLSYNKWHKRLVVGDPCRQGLSVRSYPVIGGRQVLY